MSQVVTKEFQLMVALLVLLSEKLVLLLKFSQLVRNPLFYTSSLRFYLLRLLQTELALKRKAVSVRH